MEPKKGSILNPACNICKSRVHKGDFQKLLEREDVGISIYRYISPEWSERRQEGPDIFILQTAKNVVELNLDIFANEFEKCKTYCPRCKEMIRRAEALFKEVPSAHKRGVTGLCGHVNLGDYFYCPPCKHIVDKFLKYTAHGQEDAESTRLRTYLKGSAEQVHPPIFEDAVKSAINLQAKETAETEGRKPRKERTRDEGIVGQKTRDKESVGARTRDKESIGAKSRDKDSVKGGDKENFDPKIKSTPAKVGSKGKITKGKESSKSTLQKKEGSKSEKDASDKKTHKSKSTQTGKQYDDSMDIMRMLIAQDLKDKLNQERYNKELEKNRDGIEKQALVAQRKFEQEEEERRLMLESLLHRHEGSDVPSEGMSVIEECIQEPEGVNDYIKGEKIYKTIYNQRSVLREGIAKIEPDAEVQYVPPTPPTSPTAKHSVFSTAHQHSGVLRYSLSDRTYIDKGWTLLPKEKVFRKVKIYQMRPAHPEYDWFALNKPRGHLLYDSGEMLASFEEDTSRVFYRNGDIALEYYAAEEAHAGQRLVLYSTSKNESTVLAMFDYAGNGIVFDHSGNVRLKYNQTEGVVLDPKLGPKTHWKWHSLNDSARLECVMKDNMLPYKDPYILTLGDKEEETSMKSESTLKAEQYMMSVELENYFKEQENQLKRKFQQYQIKMKALKINECFSLRILGQTAVFLMFCDGRTRFKVNMGLVLDPTTIVEQDMTELGVVVNLDRLPACSGSVERLQKVVRHARTKERVRLARHRRLNPPDPWENINLLDRRSVSLSPAATSYTRQRFSSVQEDNIRFKHLLSPSTSEQIFSCCPSVSTASRQCY